MQAFRSGGWALLLLALEGAVVVAASHGYAGYY